MSKQLAKDTVSIVIPCYNYAKFLPFAIESCLKQTHRTREIVVVDDGSTDDTAAVAKGYKQQGVKYIHQANAGPSAARNAGVRAARSEWIICLDADDMLDERYVEKCIAHAEAHPKASFVYTQMQHFGARSDVFKSRNYNVPQLLAGNYINASALIRRKDYLQHPYDEALRNGLEDWDFYLGLAEHGMTGVLLAEPLLLYRQHDDHESVNTLAHTEDNQGKNLTFLKKKHSALYQMHRLQAKLFTMRNRIEHRYYQSRARLARYVKK